MTTQETDTSAATSQPPDRLEAIIASAMDAIITVDDHHRIICFNPAAEKMFGVSADVVMGQSIEQFVPHRFRSNHSAHIRHFTDTGETGRQMGELGGISALRANGEEFPVEASISQAKTGDEHLSTVILRDVTSRRANEKAQALLAREVDHRAKNILAITSSLVSLTRAKTPQAYVESLSGRIAAMSRAHGLLAQQRWKGASIGRLVRDELEAYADVSKFDCVGPDLILSSRSVQPVSMLIHELATNAIKYGSLSLPAGHVDVNWTALPSGSIELRWVEYGGPRVTPPSEPGFGSTLIHQIVQNQLGGSFTPKWNSMGFQCIVQLPETVLQNAQDGPRKRAAGEDSASLIRKAADMGDRDEDTGGTLLIVEDEPLLAMQLAQSLSDFGWTILGVAGSVEDANRILAEKKRPDAAILDVDLGGVPVFPLARSLRRSGIPFVFCTGYEDLDYTREFADYTTVRKPATVLQIVRALRDVVRNVSAQTVMEPGR